MEVIRLAASPEILGSYLRRLMADAACWRRPVEPKSQGARHLASATHCAFAPEQAQHKNQ